MLIKSTAGLALVVLTACASKAPKREPAQARAREKISCEGAIKEAFSVDSMKTQLEAGEQAWRRAQFYLTKQFPVLIRDFMARATQNASCEDETLVNKHELDISYRVEHLNDLLSLVEDPGSAYSALRSLLFADPDFPGKMACHGPCRVYESRLGHRESQKLASKPACTEVCKTGNEFSNYFWSSSPTQNLETYCFSDVTPENQIFKQRSFIDNFASAREVLRIYLTGETPRLDRIQAEREKVRDSIVELAREYKAFLKARTPTKCPVPAIPAWAAQVRKATIRLRQGSNTGTAFFVRVPEGRMLVTAAHVSNTSPSVTERETTVVTSEKDFFTGRKEIFLLKPGRHDAERDIEFKTASAKGESLQVVRSDKIPDVGQKFFLQGFPIVAGGLYMTYACKFIGFGPGLPERMEANYTLDCPGRPRLSGISGGPVVDENGVVWGVNSAAPKYSSNFSVSPLSVGNDGKLKMGIQQIFMSDDCFNMEGAGATVPHRCQVMPRQYEKAIP